MKLKQLTSSSRKWCALLFFAVLATGSIYAQRQITGTITDRNTDEPLIGASVLVEGTSTGTVTDIDGVFNLEVSEGDVMVISYTGYEPQRITVDAATSNYAIALSAGLMIDEVIVTGYTEQSRRNISGAVTSVDAEELAALPTSNIGTAMQGRAPGVNVLSSGAPGDAPMVRIRGFGTINNNNPLYIIDGTPASSYALQEINPNDIESMQILKDASAASIYGSRAANGVIIITTKKGSVAGQSKVSVDAYYGIQTPQNFLDLLTPQQLADVQWEFQKNAGVSPSHPQYGSGATPVLPDYIRPTAGSNVDESQYSFPDNLITRANKEGTDWQDEIFDSAPMYNINVSATGGSEAGQYALSAGFFSQEGTVINTSYDRATIRANTMFRIKDRFRVGENLGVSYWESVGITGGRTGSGNAISMALRMPSIIPVYDVGGNFAGTGAAGMNNPDNPVAQLTRNKDNRFKGYRILGNVYAELDIIEGLTAKTSFNLNMSGTIDNRNFSIKNPEASEPSANDGLSQSYFNSLNWTWYNTLNYNTTIGQDHNLNVLVGTEAINDIYNELGGSRVVYFSQDVSYRVLNAGESGISNYGFQGEWSLFSLFGKVDYDFRGKYILSATVRRDGSSRFGEENRYGVFPAFSAGWRISDEAFMSGVSFINDLKIRGGWGQTGNQEIGNYPSFSTFSPDLTQAGYALSGGQNSVAVGFNSSVFGNPDVKWETTTSLNIGFDASLFNNRFDIVFDWYDRVTSDMLLQVQPPTLQGEASFPFLNVGEMKNTGIDLGIAYNSNPNRDFTYTIGVNFSQYNNEVTKLNQEDQFITGGGFREYQATRTQQGYPIGSFFGWDIEGIFQDQAEVDAHPEQTGKAPGRFKYRDVNGDGVINADDRTFIGSPHPDFMYSINLGAQWKGFDFALFFNGISGNTLFNANRLFTDFNNYFTNSQKGAATLNAWGYPGADNASATLPQLNQNAPAREWEPSTYYLEKGSYFRLQNLTVGYSLPRTTIQRAGFERLRFYIQGSNVFTITDYEGYDPAVTNSDGDVNASGSDRSIGVDEGLYPVTRIWQFGVNATF